MKNLLFLGLLMLIGSCYNAVKNNKMESKVDSSVINLWTDFIKNNPEYSDIIMPESWHFCDNEKDANECAILVTQGLKRATSTSMWWFETNNHHVPKSGDLAIITDWNGNAKAIIETTKTTVIPYNKITAEYAEIEGEGDKSLAYWKKVHWDYYSREMEEKGESPTEEMPILCEEFKTIWTIDSIISGK